MVGHLGIDRLPRRACLGGTVLGDFDRLLEPRRDRIGHVVAPFADADVEILNAWRDVAPHPPGDSVDPVGDRRFRSEEPTSELQSRMLITNDVSCLNTKEPWQTLMS